MTPLSYLHPSSLLPPPPPPPSNPPPPSPSSVALRLLHDAGVRCRAFYLRIWLEDESSHVAKGECPWEEDWQYASQVCKQVNN